MGPKACTRASGKPMVGGNFAKYMNRKMFECMRPCFCYMWADEKYWFLENKNVPWEALMPCLQSMNAKRQKLFVDLVMALYDRSMSGWRPIEDIKVRRYS